jgi:hypothetical protein
VPSCYRRDSAKACLRLTLGQQGMRHGTKKVSGSGPVASARGDRGSAWKYGCCHGPDRRTHAALHLTAACSGRDLLGLMEVVDL